MFNIIKAKCIKRHVDKSPWYKIPDDETLNLIKAYLLILGAVNTGQRWEIYFEPFERRTTILVNSATNKYQGWWINMPALHNYLANQEIEL